MKKTALKKTRTVDNEYVLPMGWHRSRDTLPLDDGPGDHELAQAGPKQRLHDELIASVDNSAEVVLAASFLFADPKLADALLAAQERGVRVYLLTASEQRLRNYSRAEGSFEEKMVREHIELLNRFVGRILVRTAEHFHAKFLVVDPRDESAHGWISTANFNKALEENVELGLRIGGSQARALAGWFNHAFWTEADRELVAKERLVPVGAPPAMPVVPQSDRILATAADQYSLRDEALRTINEASAEIVVSSYGLDKGHPTVDALCEAALRGVRVTVLTRPRPTIGAAVTRLLEAGADVMAHEKLHAKALWVDGKGIVFTANLEEHGMDKGFEVGARLGEARTSQLKTILDDWTRRFPWRLRASASLPETTQEFCSVGKLLKEGMIRIEAEELRKLPPVTVPDGLSLDDAPEPRLEVAIAPRDRRLARRVCYEWEVQSRKGKP